MRAAFLMSVALLVPSCSTKSEPQPSRDHPRAESTLNGKMPQKMRNCPSAVASAQTTWRPSADGVDVTITASDPQARADILRLAAVQTGQRDPLRMVPAHSGLHGGPGTMGRCPIIHANTTVTYRALPDGAVIHVAARSPADVSRLQQATDARVRALTTPSS